MTIPSATLDRLVEAIGTGTPVRRALEAEKVSPGSFYALLAADTSAAERYARAKERAIEAIADELRHLQDAEPPKTATQFGMKVDNGWVQWQKNRVDLLKWLLAKLAPKKYGDRVELEHSGEVKGLALNVNLAPKAKEGE